MTTVFDIVPAVKVTAAQLDTAVLESASTDVVSESFVAEKGKVAFVVQPVGAEYSALSSMFDTDVHAVGAWSVKGKDVGDDFVVTMLSKAPRIDSVVKAGEDHLFVVSAYGASVVEGYLQALHAIA